MKKYLVLLLFVWCADTSHAQSVTTISMTEKLQDLLLQKINEYRKNKRLSPFILEEGLQKSAQNQCDYILSIGTLSHKQNNSKLQTTVDRIRFFSTREYMSYGENCLKTYTSSIDLSSSQLEELAEKMFELWRNSKTHNANLLHTRFNHTGLGFRYNTSTEELYCVMDFGGN